MFNYDFLFEAACEAQKASYSPYSNFMVGAALLDKYGEVHCGCNIENAAYSPTNCAERTAFFKAVSRGIMCFDAIAVVGRKKGEALQTCAPCGVCRQVMLEFCDPASFKIVLGTSKEKLEICTLGELLPLGFGGAAFLER